MLSKWLDPALLLLTALTLLAGGVAHLAQSLIWHRYAGLPAAW